LVPDRGRNCRIDVIRLLLLLHAVLLLLAMQAAAAHSSMDNAARAT
jgi:hypothetical protein